MKVNVIGLGKLGLPLALLLAGQHEVIGIDLNDETVKGLNKGVLPFREPQLKERFNAQKIRFTSSFKDVGDADASFIIVPTPSLPDGSFTPEYVVDAVERLGESLRGVQRHHLVVIVSTLMPGQTETVVQKALERAAGREVGTSLMLAYSPEFIALGDVFNGMERPDMVLIGQADQRSGELTKNLLRSFIKNQPIYHSVSLIEAEIAKIAINTYITTKISYANYLKELCVEVGADAAKVAAAVGSDSRIGSKYFRPGTPYGGPCFPRDARAFATFSESVGVGAEMPLATAAVNDRQVDRIKVLIGKILPAGGQVGILGLSYKSGTWVSEESAGRKLAETLIADGVNVVAYDPMAKVDGIDCKDTMDQVVGTSDVIVIATGWSEFYGLSIPTNAFVLRWS